MGRDARDLRFVAWFTLVLLGLNAVLAMGNAWPTAWPTVTPLVAADLAWLVVVMAAIVGVRGSLRGWPRGILAVAVVVLAAGRYGVVTTDGLFGRPINLYWEARHLPNVAALALSSVAIWQLVLGAVIVAAAVAAAWYGAWHGVAVLARGFENRWVRRVAIIVGVVVAAWPPTPDWRTTPVIQAFARQVALVASHSRQPRVGLTAPVALTAAEAPAIAPRDVVVTFLESYGEVAFQAPDLAARLAPAYAALEATAAATGWRAASGWVEAATFAGASWLSHASLLSGAIIGDQRDYLSLLEGERPLLTDHFRAAGYRTVAVVPGIKSDWPEGAALGFDAIYDAEALAYPGDAIGWWGIPDQYSLAFLAARELDDGALRAPVFALLPTVMSHMPFGPLPAYASDWDAALAGTVAEAPDADAATYRDAYGEAVAYNVRTLAGFLEHRAPRDGIVVALGDHQPPGLVSGPAASWRVPVHVFARDDAVLAGFDGLGLVPGVRPGPVAGDVAGVWTLGTLLRAMVAP